MEGRKERMQESARRCWNRALRESGRDALVMDLIRAAVFSGAYRALARTVPEAERGLVKLADKWHARAATLADEMLARAALAPGRSSW